MAIMKKFLLIYTEDGKIKRKQGLSIRRIVDIVPFMFPNQAIKDMQKMEVGQILESMDFTVTRIE